MAVDAGIFLSRAKFLEDDAEMTSLSLLSLIFVIRAVVPLAGHGSLVCPSVWMLSISEMRSFLPDLGAATPDLPATRYGVQNFFSLRLLSLSLSLSLSL
jgi:hypothetical protein